MHAACQFYSFKKKGKEISYLSTKNKDKNIDLDTEHKSTASKRLITFKKKGKGGQEISYMVHRNKDRNIGQETE